MSQYEQDNDELNEILGKAEGRTQEPQKRKPVKKNSGTIPTWLTGNVTITITPQTVGATSTGPVTTRGSMFLCTSCRR